MFPQVIHLNLKSFLVQNQIVIELHLHQKIVQGIEIDKNIKIDLEVIVVVVNENYNQEVLIVAIKILKKVQILINHKFLVVKVKLQK